MLKQGSMAAKLNDDPRFQKLQAESGNKKNAMKFEH